MRHNRIPIWARIVAAALLLALLPFSVGRAAQPRQAPGELVSVAGRVHLPADEFGVEAPVYLAVVYLDGEALARTDAGGYFRIEQAAPGAHALAVWAGGCYTQAALDFEAAPGMPALDVSLEPALDAFGHFCRNVPAEYLPGRRIVTQRYSAWATQLRLPFEFPYFDHRYRTVYASTDGYISFLSDQVFGMYDPMSWGYPWSASIFPYSAVAFGYPAASAIRTDVYGERPHRRFVVEWTDIHPRGLPEESLDFGVVLEEGGDFWLQYRNVRGSDLARGTDETIAFGNASGMDGIVISQYMAFVEDGLSIRVQSEPNGGYVLGRVLLGRKGPAAAAEVRDLQSEARAATSERDVYELYLTAGEHTLEALSAGKIVPQARVTMRAGGVMKRDLQALPGLDYVSPPQLEFRLEQTGLDEQILTLNNPGSTPLGFVLSDASLPALAGLSFSPAAGSIPPGGQAQIAVRIAETGLWFGEYWGWLRVKTDASGAEQIAVRLHLVEVWGPYPEPYP